MTLEIPGGNLPKEVDRLARRIRHRKVTTNELLEFLDTRGAFEDPKVEPHIPYLHAVSSEVDLKELQKKIGKKEMDRIDQLVNEDSVDLWGPESLHEES